MRVCIRKFVVLVAVCIGFSLYSMMGPALAKTAKCFSSDDGFYACEFQLTDSKGSFEIFAKGKPTYYLYMDSPNLASVLADFGTGRGVPQPGPYLRQKDKACWKSKVTKAKICAW